MFALREGEASAKLAKERGLDEQLRTRMQEIGPRFTLKLRWLKRGTLGEGRKRGAAGVTQESDNLSDILAGLEDSQNGYQAPSAQDQRDEEAARKEMMAHLGEGHETLGEQLEAANGAEKDLVNEGEQMRDSVDETTATNGEPSSIEGDGITPAKKTQKKRKRGIPPTTSPKTGTIKIPQFTMPKELPKSELPHARKLRPNASILESLAVQVGHNRGGMKKSKLEWEWNPRMQVSRRKFAL
jgi:ribosome production factor 1